MEVRRIAEKGGISDQLCEEKSVSILQKKGGTDEYLVSG